MRPKLMSPSLHTELLVSTSSFARRRSSKTIPKRDAAAIERSNLVIVAKLVVKELIESSLKYGRQLDMDHASLQHFFIILEHVMRHGLKPKKALLGPRKELWNVLEFVEKTMPEAADITASVRDLPTVKTHLGRARAWLRLSLMQKHLSDYFRYLVDRKDVLSEFYEDEALMVSEEAVVIGGLLVGLNVIDCNLCVKEEDLDYQQGVIDFSLYLRDNSHLSAQNQGVESTSIASVLDQKNYIEELNRQLNTTVTNLQHRVDTLRSANVLMKEELAAAKNSILSLQEECSLYKQNQDRLLLGASKQVLTGKLDSNVEQETFQNNRAGLDLLYDEVKRQLMEEIQRRQELEHELSIQRSVRSESEMALKLLEKDIHEKQDTIISLRQQIGDIKAINLQLYNKLQECESSLRQKTERLTQLDQKAVQMTEAIQQLEVKLMKAEDEKGAAVDTTRKLGQQMAERDQKRSTLESDLKIEREWRASLQAVVDEQKSQLISLQSELENLRLAYKEFSHLKQEYSNLERKCSDNDQTLEEVGQQLKESQLLVEDLKESHRSLKEAVWTCDKEVRTCRQCQKPFSVARRKHHCRYCGEIYCNDCSDNKMPLPSSSRPERVCDGCHTVLLQRYSAT